MSHNLDALTESEEARRELRADVVQLNAKVDRLDRVIIGLTHAVDNMRGALSVQTEMLREVYATTYTGKRPMVARVAALEAQMSSAPPPSSLKYWLPVSIAFLTGVSGIVAAILTA